MCRKGFIKIAPAIQHCLAKIQGMNSSRMRPILPAAAVLTAVMLTFCAALPVQAQTPPVLEPLPETSLPPQIPLDPKLEPEITIKQRGTDKVEEFRVNGKLYMVRVTPPGGTPYILLDQTGGGTLIPQTGQADGRSISVPMWVLGTF